MEIVYLINPTAIKDITNLSDNLSDKYIRSALREAQDIGLNQVLGTRLLEKLYTLVSTGDIKNTENAKYKKLLDSHISYYLAYETITNVVVIASVKIDNAGAVTSDAEKTNGLELKDIFKIESYYRQKADFYKSRLQAYLRMEHDNFPELEYEDAYNTLAEIESAYTSTIFLGGKRGKKPYHPCYCKPAAPAPEPVKYTIRYYVDNVLFHTAKYREGQIIEWVEAPQKEGQRFNAWIYGNSDNWENIPGNMPAHDIDCYAHYLPVEGVQGYYTLRYRVADWCEDNQIDFNNMAYIQEPSFEWLQCVEREYDPNTREGWAKLTHPNLRVDTEIKIQKFTGYDCLFMLDLSDFNNTILTDRLFMDCQTIREFYVPKGLIGIEGGYTFYNCSYLTTINFATAEGYRAYEPFAYPPTGAFCNCVSLTEILADNQSNMYSQDGNLYNVSDELMAARYSDVVIKDGCTAILSEALKAHGLGTLTIPSSVRTIEVYAISENPGLSDVYFGGTMQEWADIYKPDVNTIFVDTNVTVIHCSDGDCPVDYAGEEQSEYKVDVFIEWDYLETRWFKPGERIELPEPPHRDGYVFMSWNALREDGWFETPEFMVPYNFEVHASYTANTYKLTYKVDGEIVSETDVEYGTGIMAMEAPVKEGYSFLYWDELPATMPAKDITVTAVYERNEYKITYMIDGVPYNEVRYYFEDEVQPYVPAVDEGYVFNGWDNEPATMPAHDVTVTGSMAKVEEPSEPEVVDYSQIPLTIEIIEDGDGIVKFMDNNRDIAYQYSLDNGYTWNDGTGETEIRLNNGEKAQFRNANILTGEQIGWFNIQTRYKVYGNIMSLIDFNTYKENKTLSEYANIFKNLFTMSWCVDASNLILPATTLNYGCYENMFKTCTVLTAVPELPATTLADRCYAHMFNGCENLTTYPTLPATTLAEKCYGDMFHGCTNLTTAPELPAFDLANSCYMSMFYGCTSLTAIPELPATTLEVSCCANMFRGCTSLVEIHSVLPATTLADNCYENMFSGCTNLTTAPELPATTLAPYCYQRMFNSCSKLKHITMLATDKSATNCLNLWVNGVASTGTFVKHPDMTSLPRGANGIPYNWTVEDFITELV